MIPTIGLIIGCYVFTRMFSLLVRNGNRTENIILKILAIITMLVTALCVWSLLITGLSV